MSDKSTKDLMATEGENDITQAKILSEVRKIALKKPKTIALGVGAVVLCIAAITIVWRVGNYGELKKENDELRISLSETTERLEEFDNLLEQLAYSEEQIQLYKESTNALIQQVSELKAVKEDLNNNLEKFFRSEDTVPVITRNYLDSQISALSELVTTKYMYRNATRKEGDKTWLWGWTQPFSDVSLLATYDGTITTSIDLKEVKFDIDERTKTITVTVPDSKIFDHNIPQETINVLEVKNNLFNKISFNDYNKFIAAEKIEMEKVAKEQGLLTQADEDARKVLEAFLKNVPGMDAYKLKFN